MTAAIIITLCILVLIAYVFDLTSSKTRIPGVILLLILGYAVGQGTHYFNINLPNLAPLLPILGTIGLILIVLEGSLELEFNQSKFPLIKKTFVMAFFPIIALSFLFGFAFMQYGGYPFKESLLNAIPFAVISSSIAIPSVSNQSKATKEFVIYESSLSDIIGILFFNFIAFNTAIQFSSFANFGLQLLIMAAVSFIATICLSFLLSKIDHHIKFAPIIILVILVYEVAKVYNLPSLIFILLFGLFLGNLDELKRFSWIQKLNPESLNVEVHRMKELVTEATFLVRTMFFLLFGYLTKTAEIINGDTLTWALGIVASIIIIRAIFLKIFCISFSPLIYVAPRGLINVLLFLSIAPEKLISITNKSLMIQVIFISAFVMMGGLIFSKAAKE